TPVDPHGGIIQGQDVAFGVQALYMIAIDQTRGVRPRVVVVGHSSYPVVTFYKHLSEPTAETTATRPGHVSSETFFQGGFPVCCSPVAAAFAMRPLQTLVKARELDEQQLPVGL